METNFDERPEKDQYVGGAVPESKDGEGGGREGAMSTEDVFAGLGRLHQKLDQLHEEVQRKLNLFLERLAATSSRTDPFPTYEAKSNFAAAFNQTIDLAGVCIRCPVCSEPAKLCVRRSGKVGRFALRHANGIVHGSTTAFPLLTLTKVEDR